MRILWLKTGLLLPLDAGGKLRTWHLLRHLATRHEVTYLSFADPDAPDADRNGMSAICAALHTVARRDPPKGSLGFYADAASRVLDPLPYAVGKYRSRQYRRTLRTLLARQRFDVLVCDFLFPVVNLPPTLPCPSVIFTHNVEAEIWRRYYEQQTGRIQRHLFKQQWQRMLRFEGAALRRFDLVLTVSDTDGDTLSRLYPGALRSPVFSVATGVDTTFYAPLEGEHVRPRHLVFTGAMDWIPNEDAMRWFCRDVLPIIRSEEPGVTLSIVGRSPTPRVQRLAEEVGVEVTGRVADVRDHLASATVVVVPIRIGGGTRLKIFEAMSMSKAVVSTTIGAEGLPVANGRDIVLADTSEAFARAVVSLIREPNRRAALERAARELVVTRYDWATVAVALEGALERAARREAAAAA
jgi:sugar transferase (PEP-CTERM/EpsH1 system associated)